MQVWEVTTDLMLRRSCDRAGDAGQNTGRAPHPKHALLESQCPCHGHTLDGNLALGALGRDEAAGAPGSWCSSLQWQGRVV